MVLVLWDPFALYSAGFWLSFLAVALLLLASLLHARPGLVRLQCLLLLGLLPLQLLLFEGMAPLALLINLLALPLFCLGIIPLALIGVLLAPLSSTLAHALFWLSDSGADVGVVGTRPAGGPSAALVVGSRLADARQHLAGAAVGGLAPAGRARLAAPGGAALLPGAWPAPTPWQVRVLDVGQGLSVLVTRGERGILYDTGDRYPGGYNMAEARHPAPC